MRVFVATTETQGVRKNDFCFVPEGELVGFSFECDGEPVDGPCGCHRSMSGFDCHAGTTTFKLVERADINEESFFALRVKSLVAAGWGKEDDKDLRTNVLVEVAEMVKIGAALPPDVVLEKRGKSVQMRKIPAAGRKTAGAKAQ